MKVRIPNDDEKRKHFECMLIIKDIEYNPEPEITSRYIVYDLSLGDNQSYVEGYVRALHDMHGIRA